MKTRGDHRPSILYFSKARRESAIPSKRHVASHRHSGRGGDGVSASPWPSQRGSSNATGRGSSAESLQLPKAPVSSGPACAVRGSHRRPHSEVGPSSPRFPFGPRVSLSSKFGGVLLLVQLVTQVNGHGSV